MKITFLGTGTSSGVPMIGCECEVCRSPDPRNCRRRTSLYVEVDDRAILVDTPPDFREQALAWGVKRVDAVVFTHTHADHIFGFDDIRRFNVIQKAVIPAYAAPSAMADIKRIFNYITAEGEPGLYRPMIDFKEFCGPFQVGAATIIPLEVEHGRTPTFGFRIDGDGVRIGYVPDCHSMPDETRSALKGVDLMILDALKETPHVTHLAVSESVDILQQIGAKQSLLIHMGHSLDHAATEARLPEGIRVSYDGLVIEL